jgi:probable HAF family extracellular repeat protein
MASCGPGLWLSVAMVSLLSSYTLGAPPSFQGLGDGHGSGLLSRVSGDGLTLVGGTGIGNGPEVAMLWQNGTMTTLGDLPGGDFQSKAYGVSADGSVVVGYGVIGFGTTWDGKREAFLGENGVMTGLGYLHAGDGGSLARATSADGSVVVGYSGNEAFRWEAGTMTGLGFLPSATGSQAYDVSADGSTVVGEAFSSTSQEAFIWKDGVMSGLGGLPSSHGLFSAPLAVSADVLFEAFIWKDGVMSGLGFLPGESFSTMAYDVSADGSVVVGLSRRDGVADNEAILWSAETGMVRVRDMLINLGINVDGWSLEEATGVSDDGLTIVGNGRNPDGFVEAWVAHIPEPAGLLLLSAGGFALIHRRPRMRAPSWWKYRERPSTV